MQFVDRILFLDNSAQIKTWLLLSNCVLAVYVLCLFLTAPRMVNDL